MFFVILPAVILYIYLFNKNVMPEIKNVNTSFYMFLVIQYCVYKYNKSICYNYIIFYKQIPKNYIRVHPKHISHYIIIFCGQIKLQIIYYYRKPLYEFSIDSSLVISLEKLAIRYLSSILRKKKKRYRGMASEVSQMTISIISIINKISTKISEKNIHDIKNVENYVCCTLIISIILLFARISSLFLRKKRNLKD